jgi:hypothetical protein
MEAGDMDSHIHIEDPPESRPSTRPRSSDLSDTTDTPLTDPRSAQGSSSATPHALILADQTPIRRSLPVQDQETHSNLLSARHAMIHQLQVIFTVI